MLGCYFFFPPVPIFAFYFHFFHSYFTACFHFLWHAIRLFLASSCVFHVHWKNKNRASLQPSLHVVSIIPNKKKKERKYKITIRRLLLSCEKGRRRRESNWLSIDYQCSRWGSHFDSFSIRIPKARSLACDGNAMQSNMLHSHSSKKRKRTSHSHLIEIIKRNATNSIQYRANRVWSQRRYFRSN